MGEEASASERKEEGADDRLYLLHCVPAEKKTQLKRSTFMRLGLGGDGEKERGEEEERKEGEKAVQRSVPT